MALTGVIGSAIWSANAGLPNSLLQIPKLLPFGDKLGHFLLFGALAALLDWGLNYRCWKPGQWPVPWGPTAVLAFAIGEEVSQAFLQHRSFDLLDAVADLGGVVLCTGAGRWIRHCKNPGRDRTETT